MVAVVAVVQQYQAAVQKMVVVAAQAVGETDAAEALRLLLGRQIEVAVVAVVVMSHKMVERGDQGLQLFVTQIHTQPLYQPQDRQLSLFLAGSVPTHSLAPAQSHSSNHGTLC
jgi:hypothetical protein